MPQKTEVPARASWLTLNNTFCKHCPSGLCDSIHTLFSVHPPNTKTFCLSLKGENSLWSLNKLENSKATSKKVKKENNLKGLSSHILQIFKTISELLVAGISTGFILPRSKCKITGKGETPLS